MPRTKSKPAKSKGTRIQLSGLRTTRELRAMLHEAVDEIERIGITHARGINLYLTPATADGTPLTRFPKGVKADHITIAEPYRSAADEYDP